jgi:metal-responsive CopG/Arc/MetJ family transcriptional regulator
MKMLDTPNMAKPVQISLDEKLLRRIDADPETKRRGRSAVVSSALLLYLREKQRRAIDEAIVEGFSGAAEDMARDMDPLIGAQKWPAK